MPRRMSVSLTLDAVRSRQKTVTRRHVDTWKDLNPGDHLTLIEKGMGLPKGAKQVVVCEVEIVDVRTETLRQVTVDEVRREGLWDRAVDESRRFEDYYDEDYLPVVWFRAFWACSHLGGTVADWAIGRSAPSLTGVDCRRIEFRYLDEVTG